MRAQDVIRPNSNCDYWDVPGTDKMIRCYRVIGGPMVYEVIEPSSVMGRHQTIMFLSDGQDSECYGTVSSRQADQVLSGLAGAERGDVYRTWIAELYYRCYGAIADVIGWNGLLDLGRPRLDMGRITVYADNS